MDPEDDVTIPHANLAGVPDADDIRRTSVFCSKIINRSTSLSRFRQSALFLKLVQATHPGVVRPDASGAYPRPERSPFPCFQCHRRFEGPPIFLPLEMLNGAIEEYGNFCSGPCMNTYLHLNMNDAQLAGRAADVYDYMQTVHGFEGEEIGFAPHFSLLQEYGGDLTHAQFDRLCGSANLRTRELKYPFIPTPVVVEFAYTGDVGTAGPPAAGVNGVPRVSGVPAASHGVASVASADDVLTEVMQAAPAPVDHHHRWDVGNLRQPTLDEIETRLTQLPEQETRVGLYATYLERKGGLDAPSDDDEDPMTLANIINAASNPAPAGRKTAKSTATTPVLTATRAPKTAPKRARAGAGGAPAPVNALTSLVTAGPAPRKR